MSASFNDTYTAREAPVTMPASGDDARRALPPVMYAHLSGYLDEYGTRQFSLLGAQLQNEELARGWSVYVGCMVRRATRGLDDPREIKAAVDKLFLPW